MINSIGTFFTDMGKDVQMLMKRTDSATNRDKRIQSLALRVIGTLAAAVAVGLALSGLATVIFAPITAGCTLPLAVILAVAAHELIVIGNNQRKFLPDTLNPSFKQAAGIVLEGVRAGYNIAKTGIPYELQGTWVAAPVYSLCHRKA